MARKTKAEAEETRQQLLDAAEQMFFEQGVSRTSLETIARHAGMTRGAVYWHFDNKVSLLEALIQRVRLPLNDMEDELCASCGKRSPIDALKQILEMGLQRCEESRSRRVYMIIFFRCEFFDQLSSECREHEYLTGLRELFQRVFEAAQRAGQLSPAVTPHDAANLVYYTSTGLLHDWLRSPEYYSLAEHGRMTLGILLDGLKA